MIKNWKKIVCFLWAAWIFGSSCTVITRQQFVNSASTATRINQKAVSNVWESFWWVFVKGYHVLEYTVLTILLLVAFEFFRRKPAWATAVAIGYAATDEWHQTFVPHRGGHISDVLIDSLGVVIALGLFTFWQRRSQRKLAATAA